MANINVRKRIESISDDLDRLIKHVEQYSGIDDKDAIYIDNVASQMSEAAARLAEHAREPGRATWVDRQAGA